MPSTRIIHLQSPTNKQILLLKLRHRRMKIGIAQINPTVGDLDGNRAQILEAYTQLVSQGAELVLAPELATCGYQPRDLLFKSRFVSDVEASLANLAQKIESVPLVVGTVTARDGSYYNSAAWCEHGKVQTIGSKSLLPNYDVFDETRYFKPADSPTIHHWQGLKIGLTICEDLWALSDLPRGTRYATDPLHILKEEKVDLILNLSASPWHAGKSGQRESLVRAAADRCNCPIVYCNLVGGNDELIFDGGSLVAHPQRGILAGLAAFREENAVIDLQSETHPHVSEHYNPVGMAAIHQALVLGLRDYAHKCGFKRVLLGLSGGIDSAVVCALAAEALGPENVIGIALPSAISSEHSRRDAADLAQGLGIEFHEIPISETVASAEAALQPLFKDLPVDVTEENLQARARGLLLMALSNKYGALLLTTGNKSEIAVGYCTLYGDMCGGLAVISDLPKMKVYALARHLNNDRERIPLNTIEKAPSAELRPDQADSDSLPPYPQLDGILQLYVEEGRSRSEIVAAGYQQDTVDAIVRLVDLNEYKRKQAAPGLKTTPLAFGLGRRIPIVQKYVN
jgi:NAD+ synthase (glutamine-hydrolysing)